MPIYDRQLDVPETVESIKDTIDLFKSSQNVGSDSIQLYTSQTNNTWDVTFNVPAFADAQWRVTFTPDIPGRFYAEIGIDYQVTFNTDNVYYWPDHTDIYSETSRSFIVAKIMSFDAQTVNLKFQFRSVSPGTISWTKIV